MGVPDLAEIVRSIETWVAGMELDKEREVELKDSVAWTQDDSTSATVTFTLAATVHDVPALQPYNAPPIL
jgi:hypothetical protein